MERPFFWLIPTCIWCPPMPQSALWSQTTILLGLDTERSWRDLTRLSLWTTLPGDIKVRVLTWRFLFQAIMGVLFDSRPVHMLVQAPTTVWREQRKLPPREHSCGNPSRFATTDVLLNWAPKNDSFGRLMLFRVGNLASETFVSKSLSEGLEQHGWPVSVHRRGEARIDAVWRKIRDQFVVDWYLLRIRFKLLSFQDEAN